MPQNPEPVSTGRQAAPATVDLGSETARFGVDQPSLRDRVATKVLALFKVSLIGTLVSAAVILVIDEAYIYQKIITPEQRLLSEKVLMTLIGATVVQIGAALAAIVFAVFKSDREGGESKE